MILLNCQRFNFFSNLSPTQAYNYSIRSQKQVVIYYLDYQKLFITQSFPISYNRTSCVTKRGLYSKQEQNVNFASKQSLHRSKAKKKCQGRSLSSKLLNV